MPHGDTLISLLARNAKEAPSRIAVREREFGIWREYSWSAYLHEVTALAAGLEALGLRRNEPAVIIGDNRARLYFGMAAAAMLGAHAMPLYPETPADGARPFHQHRASASLSSRIRSRPISSWRCGRGRARLKIIVYDDPRGVSTYHASNLFSYESVLAQGKARARTRRRNWPMRSLERATPEDWAVMLHSSGTTGKPKGVPLKHRHLIAAVRQAAEAGYFHEHDTLMGYLPMAWVGDYSFSVAATIALQGTLCIPERQETAMHDIREIAPTFFFASARSWDNLLTRLQVQISESTPLKRALVRHFMQFAMGLERKRLAGKRTAPLSSLWRSRGRGSGLWPDQGSPRLEPRQALLYGRRGRGRRHVPLFSRPWPQLEAVLWAKRELRADGRAARRRGPAAYGGASAAGRRNPTSPRRARS